MFGIVDKLRHKYNKWLAYKHPYHRLIFEVCPLYSSSLFWNYVGKKLSDEIVGVFKACEDIKQGLVNNANK